MLHTMLHYGKMKDPSMSDSENDIHNLASQYFDLWQKQLQAQSSDKLVNDSLNLANAFNQQAAEAMKTLDTPEKVQQWMGTWAESWKEQFKDGQNPFEQFNTAKTDGTASASAASGHTQHDMDELSRRVSELEARLAELESRLKD